ncbi:hypothetical protein NDU88_005257 [Pleurodeles waltl]|uniref:Uncharacterized protein n=1 Tax=Pleurodeles waltl TaxID=8319 RepID=A0AAV7UIP5_PLEWA|nr:hypothetical protein NDU88_005257 [Pleurodeles waltl]
MMRILIKYAVKDRSKILEEIDKIRLELLTIITQETLDEFMQNLENKLIKLEEDITTKKQRKFIRDYKDDQAGRILTFHRKYVHMYKEETSELCFKNLETTAVSTEELVESNVSDGNLSDVSDTALSKGVVVDKGTERSDILKQFRLLNQGQTDQNSISERQRGWAQMKKKRNRQAKNRRWRRKHKTVESGYSCSKVNNMDVINLSSRTLSSDEKSLRALGLYFCPTGCFNYVQTRIDIFKFIQKLKLKKLYQTKVSNMEKKKIQCEYSNLCISDIEILHTLADLHDGMSVHEDAILNLEGLGISLDDPCPSNLKPKSTFLPAIQCDAIDAFEREVIKHLKKMRYKGRDGKMNLSRVQWKALQDLKKDQTIVMRQSDKGGNAVVQDISKYVAEGLRQLSSSKCYEQIRYEDIKLMNDEYHGMLVDWREKGLIDWDEFLFLKCDYPRIPVLYLLPKVHKDRTNPPGT